MACGVRRGEKKGDLENMWSARGEGERVWV